MTEKLPSDTVPQYHLDHVLIAPGRQIGAHRQNTWELSYVVCGSGERTVGTQREPFRSGDMVLIPPGELHGWDFTQEETDADGRVENYTLTFPDAALSLIASLMPQTADKMQALRDTDGAIRIGGATSHAVGRLLEQMETQHGAVRRLSAVQIVISIAEGEDVTVMVRGVRRTVAEQRLRDIETYLRCNIQRQVTLADIALHTGMNRSSLCSFFRRETGETIFSRLTAMRVEHARYLLRASTQTVAEVCWHCGFNDVPHFNRTFRRLTGLTPTQYRRRGNDE